MKITKLFIMYFSQTPVAFVVLDSNEVFSTLEADENTRTSF